MLSDDQLDLATKCFKEAIKAGTNDEEESMTLLTMAARNALSLSYAPHSESPSAVIIELLCNGDNAKTEEEANSQQVIVIGPYLENAAYNPSLAPLQVTLAINFLCPHLYFVPQLHFFC